MLFFKKGLIAIFGVFIGVFGMSKLVSADTYQLSDYYISIFNTTGTYASTRSILCLSDFTLENIYGFNGVVWLDSDFDEVDDYQYFYIYLQGSNTLYNSYSTAYNNLFNINGESTNTFKSLVNTSIEITPSSAYYQYFSLSSTSLLNYRYYYIYFVGYDSDSKYVYVGDSLTDYIIIPSFTLNDYELGYNEGFNAIYTDYNNLQTQYNELYTTYTTLQSSYSSLESTYNTIVNNYNTLQSQYNELLENEYSFSNLFWAISSIPFGIYGSMFNFEILGVNFFALTTGIITGFIVIWLVKKFFLK